MDQLSLFPIKPRRTVRPKNFHERTLQTAIDDMQSGKKYPGDILMLVRNLKVAGLRPVFIDQVLVHDMPAIDAYDPKIADRIYAMLIGTKQQVETNVTRSA